MFGFFEVEAQNPNPVHTHLTAPRTGHAGPSAKARLWEQQKQRGGFRMSRAQEVQSLILVWDQTNAEFNKCVVFLVHQEL